MRQQTRFILLFTIILIAIVGIYFYALPRWAGERFIRTIAQVDLEAAQAQLCDGTNLGDTLNLLDGGITRLDNALTALIGSPINLPRSDALANNLTLATSRYNPLTGTYTATLKLSGELTVAGITLSSGVTSSPIQYQILREGLLSTCIAPTVE